MTHTNFLEDNLCIDAANPPNIPNEDLHHKEVDDPQVVAGSVMLSILLCHFLCFYLCALDLPNKKSSFFSLFKFPPNQKIYAKLKSLWNSSVNSWSGVILGIVGTTSEFYWRFLRINMKIKIYSWSGILGSFGSWTLFRVSETKSTWDLSPTTRGLLLTGSQLSFQPEFYLTGKNHLLSLVLILPFYLDPWFGT